MSSNNSTFTRSPLCYLKPLIPDIILENYEKGQNSGNFEAFTLFIDLSGFTAMTEQLLTSGSKGAELLSQILNSIFEPLVEVVYAFDGFIPCFAGDAFVAVFPKNTIAAAEILQMANDFTNLFCGQQFGAEFEIRCKIGLSFGRVDWGIVGTTPKSYYFRGPAILDSAESQLRAAAEQIIAYENFVALCADKSEVYHLGEGYYLIQKRSLSNLTHKTKAEKRNFSEKTLQLFLPQSILESNLPAEFRDIVAVFISFRGIDTHEALDGFATDILQIAERFSGYFKEIDFGDKGGVIPVIFGAPLSWENNLERALGFALSVAELTVHSEDFALGIGVSSGLAYTGIIGGQRRCQYAAVGNIVNLAARLMSAAENRQILTDEASTHCAGFAFLEKGKIQLKGIGERTAVWQLSGRTEIGEAAYIGPVAGRTEELAFLNDFAAPLEEKQFAGVAMVWGEPGIGKSRLCHELKNIQCGSHEIEYILCLSDQILKKPFNPLIYALRNAFGQSGERTASENKVIFEEHFSKLLSQLLESTHAQVDGIIRELLRTRSVLAGLAGISIEDSLWTQLDARGRHENTKVALLNYFCARALLTPLIVEFEDWHWVDAETNNLLPDFVERLKSLPVLILITSRYADDGQKPQIISDSFLEKNGIPQLSLDLNILGPQAIRQMAESRLNGRIDAAFLDLLQRSATGNPFYTEQMLEYFAESALLENAGESWKIKDKSTKIGGSVNAVLTARVDRLSYLVKETVKAAAVIGREFELPVLSEIMNRHGDFASQNGSQQLLKEQVQTAERGQIWRAVSDIRYIFKHSLMREAVYEMQLGSQLRKLHKQIAEAIVRVYAHSLEERFADLAFHYEQAGETDLTVKYLEKAADYACRNYQNTMALAYLEKLCAVYPKNSSFEAYINNLLKKGEVEQLMGSWEDANKSFALALKTAQKSGDLLLSARSANAFGNLLMMKGNYEGARQYFSDALDIMRAQKNAGGISKSLEGLGNLGFRMGDYEAAKSHFLQSIDMLQFAEENSISPQLISNLGLTYMNLNKYDEGVATIQHFLPISKSLNDRQGLAYLHTHLGVIYYEKGDYDAALLHYLDGLALSEELGNKFLESIALGGTGCIYEHRGEFNKAKTYFEEDLKLAQSLGDRQGMAIAYGLLGAHFVLIGDFNNALQYLEPNLRLCEELGYRKGLIRALNTIAEIAFYKGNYGEAIEYYKRSISASEEINNKLLQGIALIDLCFIYLQIGEKEQAAELHSNLREHLEVVTKKTFHFRYLLLSAALCNVRNEKEQAERILREALKNHEVSAEETAAVYDQLSAVVPDSEELRQKAISCYEALYQKTPKFLYLHRIQKLRTTAN